jgi:putative SOS response-associated peptidase YedK
MAGIALNRGTELVTLTTKPNPQCADFHHRMPLLLSETSIINWLTGTADQANELLFAGYQKELKVVMANPVSSQKRTSNPPQQGSLF